MFQVTSPHSMPHLQTHRCFCHCRPFQLSQVWILSWVLSSLSFKIRKVGPKKSFSYACANPCCQVMPSMTVIQWSRCRYSSDVQWYSRQGERIQNVKSNNTSATQHNIIQPTASALKIEIRNMQKTFLCRCLVSGTDNIITNGKGSKGALFW